MTSGARPIDERWQLPIANRDQLLIANRHPTNARPIAHRMIFRIANRPLAMRAIANC
jgi:hypothetical protein